MVGKMRKLKSRSVFTSVALGVVLVAAIGFGTMVQQSGRAAGVPGDVNNDNVVNVFDLSILLNNWGMSGVSSDINNDSKVDVFDLSILLSGWGKTGPSPSPTPTPTPAATPTPPPAVSGTQYYVSNSGSDSNTGKSPSAAWKTIGKVNSMTKSGAVKHGDGVAFERGGEFFGTIGGPGTSSSGAYLTISAYGAGPKPKITGYKVLSNASAWTNTGSNVWRINIINGTSYTGATPANLVNNNADSAFLKVNGQIYGAKKWSTSSLSSQWDFYSDSTYLYVKSSANPTTMASDLRVATDGVLVKGFSYIYLKGLELVGIGGHGYQQTGSNTKVEDNYFHEIGGSHLHETTRYGNGIEMWLGSKNAVIQNNEIAEVWDTAITIQGENARSENIHFRNNKFWNTTQVFEYWTRGSGSTNGIYNSSFTDNVAVNAGYSWGYPHRPDKVGRGTFQMAYSQELGMSFNMSRNIFFNARDNYAYSSPNAGKFRSGYVSDHNLIVLRSGEKIVAQLSYTFEQHAAYISATGQEKASTWMLLPSSASTPQGALDYVNANLSTLKGMIR